MPLMRTKNAVFLVSVIIGLAGSAGGASAGPAGSALDSEPFRVAQAGPGGGGANAEEEKRKREEEARKKKQQEQPRQQPPGGAGGAGGGHPGQIQRVQPGGGGGGGGGSGGGGMTPPGDHRIQRDPGRVNEKPPVIEHKQPDTFRKRDEIAPRGQPGSGQPQGLGTEKPVIQKPREPGAIIKKDDGPPRGQSGGGQQLGTPPGKPSGPDSKQPGTGLKKDDGPKAGTAGDKHPGAGSGQPQGGMPPANTGRKAFDGPQRDGPDGRKKDDGKGAPPPQGGAGGGLRSGPGAPPPLGGEKPLPPQGGPGGGLRTGPGGPPPLGVDKPLPPQGGPGIGPRPGPGGPPPFILPKPAAEELDLRRKERQNFARERLKDVAGQRREERDRDGRLIIVEPGNRRIIREEGRAFIRHDEAERFRGYGRDFRTEDGPGGERRTMFTRPDGVVIITIVDADGRLLRRLRRDRDGREFVLIDNRPERWSRHRGRAIGGFGFLVELPPPVIRIPRERYYVDADYASEEEIYEALSAPPVDFLEPDYTLDEIRYSPSLRDRLRRVSLSSINFEFGSWELREDQIARLEVVANAMRAILRRNPDEMFLIGGHTDAVGSDDDNLSLSDRRAETVARVMTDEFGIPAENLVTQGYGEQYLLIPTSGPEVRNRRVEFQRITPGLARRND